MNNRTIKDVLIIEDDPGITFLITEKLSDNEYTPIGVSCAKEGIEYLQTSIPYLMILDYGLPDMSGLEFVEQLKAMDLYVPPFIVSTGTDDTRIAVEMMRFGARDFLIKDTFLLDRLLASVKRLETELENERLLKQAEDDLQKKNEELKKSLEQISQINDELETARKKAEESDRLKTAFLANLSHEIRTPMNGILGFANLLKDTQLSKDDQKEYLEIIESSGHRMLKLITDLVDISKIEAGQMEIELEDTDLNRLLDDLFSFFKPNASTKQISLNYDKHFPDEGMLISTDRTKLEQILTNLISNAFKFTQQGRVEFGYRQKNEYTLLFWVRDTGIGIEKEKQDSIFVRFVQAESDFDRINEGSGLGLSIAKAFINSMGGDIWVESELNQGSVFYFTLPFTRIREGDEDVLETSDVRLRIHDETTILVVEDEEMNFIFLREILRHPMIKILHAGNGVEAIQMVEKNPEIALILMDIKMPEMNGIEATRLIRQIRPDIPVIGQSAYASPTDRESALRAGFIDYVIKPIGREELFRKLNAALEM